CAVLFLLSLHDALPIFGFQPILGLDPMAHEGDRASGPLTAIWYAIFILPMLLFTPDIARRAAPSGAIRRGLAELGRTLRRLPSEDRKSTRLNSSHVKIS